MVTGFLGTVVNVTYNKMWHSHSQDDRQSSRFFEQQYGVTIRGEESYLRWVGTWGKKIICAMEPHAVDDINILLKESCVALVHEEQRDSSIHHQIRISSLQTHQNISQKNGLSGLRTISPQTVYIVKLV